MTRRPFAAVGRRLLAAVLALGILVPAALTGCAGTGRGSTGGDAAARPSGTINVFAAASLKAPFTELAHTFESENPGTSVTLSFAGSSDLVSQISQGAPADIFASADTANMQKLKDAGLVDGTPRNFATNTLAIAVPPGNPAGIASLQDLARPDVRLVTCARQVPCGAAAAKVAAAAGLRLSPVSEENAVTDVLGKVTSAEADAGLVYATDIKAAGTKVKGIDFPESQGAVNTYPITATTAGRNKAAVQAFLDLVAGAEGQKVLAAAGFGPGSQ